ncbi:GHKL domain-containing protein, partial [Lactobacillus johnsonii]|uniref:GHKL domain-containing protein n=1 Tax=Lactobacillus johnsonii TaxID=33959 RepID=UPI001093A35C
IRSHLSSSLSVQFIIAIYVRNKIKNIPQLSKIQQTGFSTKKNHQGLGLSNINQLKQKYPTLFVNYRINNNWFIFTLNIVGVDE